ncbi:hypothetical protein GMA12_11130 [Kocuria sediminis]|uniref:SGNH/GDSL hydrolase family protein n=1 Tax=Kocuria sediminis TaxID=1038857 RepID=A0A6N8GLP4_9MICC|nr:hypothetical protein [Kocuria sediminis]MUN63689.1 hypothetical protein [Kocuria sediminis]
MVVSRRSLVRSGALLAVSGALGGALVRPGAQGSGFVLWGSSSAASALHREHPPGYGPVRIDVLLSRLLGVPGTCRAVGGDESWQTLAMRSYDHPYRPDLSAEGWRLPVQGQVVVPTADGRAPDGAPPLPGTVDGVVCSIRAVPGREGAVVLRRHVPGPAVELGPGPRSWWHTDLESRHRGQVHLFWTGKNNIEDPGRVLADTRAAWAVEPARSVVMGHWHTWRDRRGTAGWEQVRAVNAAYRAEYGPAYHDTMADLCDPQLWALPALRPYRIGESPEDRRWLALGLPPCSVVAGDRKHLNALGNTLVAHGLHRRLTGPAGPY